jgi:hypothetical protein
MKKIVLILIVLLPFVGYSQTYTDNQGNVFELSENNEIQNDTLFIGPSNFQVKQFIRTEISGDKLINYFKGYNPKSINIIDNQNIVWKEIFSIQEGEIKLFEIVQGIYVPRQIVEEQILFNKSK